MFFMPLQALKKKLRRFVCGPGGFEGLGGEFFPPSRPISEIVVAISM